jgi:dTDP-4-dehydrorhamnose 3,5-epimerase-like enzyme
VTIKECKKIDISTRKDSRGDLSFVENLVHIPFEIKRVFYLHGIPKGTERGGHAHKDLTELIVCLNGTFDLYLDDGINKKQFHLDSPTKGIIVTSMIWREMKNFSEGSVCMVLASNFYDESDYFRDYDKFIKAL